LSKILSVKENDMADLRKTCEPKSDQANYDDFIGDLTKTIKITKVSVVAGDQPVIINFEGDNGKPYKPGKSMRRVLVHVWGADGNNYVGRSLTLYGDPKIVFGGAAVGGIRISHMSHIDAPVTMALTATRASRKPFTVKPLVVTQQEDDPKLSKEQQMEIVGKLGKAGIESQTFKDAFGVQKTLGELKVSQLEDIDGWILGQQSA
jgi:hypothetical protein